MSKKRKDSNGILLRKGERQLPNGHYQYRYTDSFGNRHSANAETLNDLREKVRAITRDDENGVSYADGNITVLKLVERYVKLKKCSRRSTQAKYGIVIGHLNREQFGKHRIRDIRVSDAKLWFIDMQSRGFRYATLETIRRVVKPAFSMAVDEDLIRKNPFLFKLTDVVVNDTVPRMALTAEQESVWMNFIRTDSVYSKHYNEFVVLFGTGMRVSEFCGLTRKDLDFENRIINVDHQLLENKAKGNYEYYVEKTKTRSGTRKIPMTDEVFTALKNILGNRPKLKRETIVDGYAGFILMTREGNPMTARLMARLFQRVEKKFRKRYPDILLPHVTPHVARHTFATRMAQNGMDVKALQYLLGHANATVTLNVYTHTDYDYASGQLLKFGQKKIEGAG